MSLRSKIGLAMMAVVAGITLATLWVTQQSVEATYERVSRERFESEVESFSRLRSARLGAVQGKCLELAHSVRVIAAIHEGDPELLYRTAFDELRDVLQPLEGNPLARPASFFRFVDGSGRILSPPDRRAAAVAEGADPEWQHAVERVAAAGGSQEVGYLALEIEGRAGLHEVVATPIVDPVDGAWLGTLVIGFPLEGPGAALEGGHGRIRSGIWLDGRLHASTIPASLEASLEESVIRTPAGSATFDVAGVPHRAFRRPLTAGSRFPPAFAIGLYSMQESIERQQSLVRRVLATGAAALLAGFGLSLLLAHGLSVPIRELVAGSREVERGNLDVRVAVRTGDEIGRLGSAFNEMVSGLALKERYRGILNLVSDPEVAQRMIDGELAPGGEERIVSMLFCDIRGFTSLTEGMAPVEVIELLNEHMTALTAVVHEHHGVVDKFVGDELMALFGAPTSRGRDAEDAVRAAWQMIESRRRLNELSRHRVEIGIGVASGPVVAGCMGSSDRLNYTVLGDRVNLGSRLCGAAARMEILVDQATRDAAAMCADFEELPPLALKGFREPLPAWRVVGLTGRESPP